jgi:hypothetical protein
MLRQSRLRAAFWLTLVACGDPELVFQPGGNGGEGPQPSDGGGGNGSFTTSGMGGECALLGAPCDFVEQVPTGVCTQGEICCPIALACNNVCCGAAEVCSFGSCETPGKECAALGEPVEPPAPGCVAGAPVSTGKCLPKPPVCPDGTEPDPENLTCLASCQVVTDAPFTPQLNYSWGDEVFQPFSTDVMMAPIVISLDDDDCDGKITARDIPEIVFSSFTSGAYSTNGVLHAISILEGAVVDKWSADGIHPTKQLAGGNIDGVEGNEIVGCMVDGTVRAWNGDGSVLWTTAAATDCYMPSIADLDGDGDVEVVVEGGILDGVTGSLEQAFEVPVASSFVVSDVDGDGELDVVTGSQVFHADGTLVVDTGIANTGSFRMTGDWKSPWPAIGDLDGDGSPEIVVVHNQDREILVWRVDAGAAEGFEIVRQPTDLNGTLPNNTCGPGSWGNLHGGGPPTIADFTGDGVPDVAAAGAIGYAVFDGALLMDPAVAGPDTILWLNPTVDCSSASTGSTVFDFNGDGIAEVMYGDQQRLRIYDGPTGEVLWETCNTNATLAENPVVADVDNDGHADIVAVANGYGAGNPQVQCFDDTGSDRQAGVHVFGASDGNWVRTRRVWNQHAYHVTNIGEDGSVPQDELDNWLQTGLNNFRQNKQPGSEFSAPDAVVQLTTDCTPDFRLVAIVRNIGEAALPAGVPVTFYQGSPPGTLLGESVTLSNLYAAEAEAVSLVIDPALMDNTKVYAVVDEDPDHPGWVECRTDNNQSQLETVDCNIAE